jgi:cytochrome c553
MRKLLVIAAIVAIASPLLRAADAAPVPYPRGWRQWTHVKSMTINPGHALHDAFGGIHHLYANKDTGGWGFEGFKGDSKSERAVGNNAAAACFQCHTAQKNNDFVFSTFRK